MNPLNAIDFYKSGHFRQNPENTQRVYINETPRGSRLSGVHHLLWFGIQKYVLNYLIDDWNKNFFQKPLNKIIERYKRRMDNALGVGVVTTDHIEALHLLQFLPLHLKSLAEGTLVPMRVPLWTMMATRPEFAWLAEYLETDISMNTWKAPTQATIAFEYFKAFHDYYNLTVGDPNGQAAIRYQGHCFSDRGMSYREDAAMTSAAHMIAGFYGTDGVMGIDLLEDYYFADSDTTIVGTSIPATEHSVMCLGGQNTYETVRRLITQIYPSGPVSIVWDTWDYWHDMTETLSLLKNDIINRTGHSLGFDKVVIRGDSGDPYRIIVGYFPEELIQHDGKMYYKGDGSDKSLKEKELTQAEIDGSIQVMWNIFGGSVTQSGYRQLSEKVGYIYGDSITLHKQIEILDGLMRKNFASTNVVLGIGSFTYQGGGTDANGKPYWITRDLFGIAIKATWAMIDDVPHNLFKAPKTDNGTKNSAKGLLAVFMNEEGELWLKEECTPEEEKTGLLETIFLDGKLVKYTTLDEIRNRVYSNL